LDEKNNAKSKREKRMSNRGRKQREQRKRNKKQEGGVKKESKEQRRKREKESQGKSKGNTKMHRSIHRENSIVYIQSSWCIQSSWNCFDSLLFHLCSLSAGCAYVGSIILLSSLTAVCASTFTPIPPFR
jgi:hypothetical protein